jgi:hypothetical protein
MPRRSASRGKTFGPGHVAGPTCRRGADVREEKRYLVEDTEVRLVRRDDVEFADQLEQRRDALGLVPRIEDQGTELSSGLEGVEALQGSIELAAAPAIELERAQDGTDARQKL